MEWVKCENCRFFNKHPKYNYGECHRRAPGIDPQMMWPEIKPDNWCGEFEKKEEKEAGK